MKINPLTQEQPLFLSWYLSFHKHFCLFVCFYFYFWLHWVFVAAHGLSLIAASGGYSSLRCMGFSLRWLLLLQSTGSRCAGFSSCNTWAQQLWRTGLVALRHVGSSWTRDRTRDPCIGRHILNHCAAHELFIVVIQLHLHMYFIFKKFNHTTYAVLQPAFSIQQYIITIFLCQQTNFYNIYIYFLAVSHSLWDLNSRTRD